MTRPPSNKVILTLTWGALLLWLGLTSYVSGLPGPTADRFARVVFLDFDAREFLYHTLAFAVLGLLLYRTAILHLSARTPVIFVMSVIIGTSYGIIDEAHQSFVPGRFVSALDIGYDFVGVFVGSLSGIYVSKRMIRHSTAKRSISRETSDRVHEETD